MAKKTRHNPGGVVYSTNPDYDFGMPDGGPETAAPGDQRLRVRLDSRQRKGKVVTLVEGFAGTEEALQALGKKLKTACGSGGSAKDGEILVQGDHLSQVRTLLGAWGYRVS